MVNFIETMKTARVQIASDSIIEIKDPTREIRAEISSIKRQLRKPRRANWITRYKRWR